MKLPTDFLPEKNLEGTVNDLLETEYSPGTVSRLICLGYEFSEKVGSLNYDDSYLEGVKISESIDYTFKDVEELSKRIKVRTEGDRWLGLYISALINKGITKEYTLTLALNSELNGIGSYLEKGTIIVEGNANHYKGLGMKGGKIIVEGNTNGCTGEGMRGGSIIVKGNANDNTGYFMEGGKIIVEGKVNKYTGWNVEGGQIIVKGSKIHMKK